MRMLVSDMAGRASIELKGRELGFDLSPDRDRAGHPGHRPGQGAGGGGLHLRGGGRVVRAAPARGGRRRPARLLRRRVLAGLTESRPGGDAVGGDRQAGGRRSALRRDRGGQRPGQRPRRRPAAGARGRSTPSSRARAHRLQGADPRRGARHGRRHPGPHRDADAGTSWQTVGVGANIVEASWQALGDAVYGLLSAGVPRR